MSTIHFVGGEKGGVGKSVCARVLCQYCVDRELPFAGIDADTSHGALMRYYGHYSQAVDLEQFDSSDQIMDRALGSERHVIVDLPAQSVRALSRWLESGNVLGFAQEMNIRVCFWYVSDGGYDSVNELERMMATGDGRLELIVVKNRGRSLDFSQFDESDTLRELHRRGGQVMEMPALHAATMYKIDRKGSSFWAALNSESAELALLPMEKQRTKLWLSHAYAAVDSTHCMSMRSDPSQRVE